MRNLKRVLALAMAMIMMLGMMVIGTSAASYKDAETIDANYAEAIEILTGMGVFKGQSTTESVFAPKAVLTRAEAAALIYRVITGDVADKQVQNYDYASLKDVQAGKWFTGYVTYANNGGYIKGDENGNFNPNASVTGVQVLAIMLRAAGYGQNGEYEGAAWKDNILTDAKELGIIGGISTATLDAPATRELVAQLIFNAITEVKMVTYNNLLGYVPVKWTDIKNAGQTLALKIFGLTPVAAEDNWGRPATKWYDANVGVVKGTYATIAKKAVATYYVATSECDIAKDLKLSGKTNAVTVWYNGVATSDNINALSQTKLGAQGTLIEVYDAKHIVVIDTFLAKVAGITTEKTDKNGHVVREASVTLAVWNTEDKTTATKTVAGTFEYAVGDYVLVYINNAKAYTQIVSAAESVVATQDKIWYNASKHTLEGTDYMDAVHFYLNEAGYEKTAHTWFFDLYGNLIGAADIATIYNYAVLKDIIWVVGRPGYAEATLVYMDGTEATVTVNTFDGLKVTFDGELGSMDALPALYTAGWDFEKDNLDPILLDVGLSGVLGAVTFPGVSSDGKYNTGYEGYALYEVTTNKDGSVNLNGFNARKVDNALEADEIVRFAPDATLSTNARQFLDNGEKVYMTTATEILIKNGKDYDTATVSTLADYAFETCEIFYTAKVMYKGTANEMLVADRIYIKSGVVSKEFGEHAFVTTKTFYELPGAAGVAYMAMNVDGEDTLVYMETSMAAELAKNVGKLYHIEYVENPYSKEYGMIDEARLVNDYEEDACSYDCCDYLAHLTTVLGDTIICDGESYTVTEETVFIGVKDYAEFMDVVTDKDASAGIWVLSDKINRVQYAEVIYVGTELSSDVNIIVKYDADCSAKWNTANTELTITLPVGKDSANVTVEAVAANTLLQWGKNKVTDIDLREVAAADETYTVTVYAEDGLTTATYTIKVVGTEATSKVVIDKVWDREKTIYAMSGNATGYTTVKEAVKAGNVYTLDLNQIETLSVPTVSGIGATKIEYAVFTSTSEAETTGYYSGGYSTFAADNKIENINTVVEAGDVLMVMIEAGGVNYFTAFVIK